MLAQMKCVGSVYWAAGEGRGEVGGGICSCRCDDKCNGDDSLCSIAAAARPAGVRGEVSGHSFALIPPAP